MSPLLSWGPWGPQRANVSPQGHDKWAGGTCPQTGGRAPRLGVCFSKKHATTSSLEPKNTTNPTFHIRLISEFCYDGNSSLWIPYLPFLDRIWLAFVLGAGPAGLTAAYELGKRDHKAVVLEADDVVGGISRTARVGDWRFDIGGHRFFTKVTPVRDLWHEILPDEDFLLRPRMSRIFYRGRFYDYPLRAFNALRNLGVLEAVRCVLSYLWVRIRPPKDLTTFEGYIASKFGWRLYGIFFKTYTEKVWGVPADQIQADWAAQRVKNLDLLRAIINSLAPRRNQKEITSLIEEFEYPRHGPGMMWERCHELVEGQGGGRLDALDIGLGRLVAAEPACVRLAELGEELGAAALDLEIADLLQRPLLGDDLGGEGDGRCAQFTLGRQIVDEAEAYAEAGVHHVVAAPWRRTAEEWIDSMERLVELVPLD